MENKKGVMGLDTASKFLLAFLILAVVGFAAIIALNSVADVDIGGNTENVFVGYFNNETINLTDSLDVGGNVPVNVTSLSVTVLSITLSDVVAVNDPNKSDILVQNTDFTINSTGGFFPVDSDFNGSAINISARLSYTITGDARELIANTTTGTSDLFTNATTWFSLLAIIIVILIISVVIITVRSFSGTSRL